MLLNVFAFILMSNLNILGLTKISFDSLTAYLSTLQHSKPGHVDMMEFNARVDCDSIVSNSVGALYIVLYFVVK
jgi:hypothetical protein